MVDLDALEAAMAKATPRPWELLTATNWGEDHGAGAKRGASDVFGVGSGRLIGRGTICGPYMDFWDVTEPFADNAAAIVAMMNAAPQLLAIAKAAREVLTADSAAESGDDGADRRWDEAIDRLRDALDGET